MQTKKDLTSARIPAQRRDNTADFPAWWLVEAGTLGQRVKTAFLQRPDSERWARG